MSNLPLSLGVAAVLGICPLLQVSAAAPSDNPIQTFYNAKSDPGYPWTDTIEWTNVVETTATPDDGLDDLATVQAELDALADAGGGVYYMPAGQYDFSDTLRLPDFVVIRGETPTVTDAKDVRFAPPTKLYFPKYIPTFTGSGTPNDTAFKDIWNAEGDIGTHKGLVWLEVNRATISFGGSYGMAINNFVFGVRNNNSATPQSDIPRGAPDDDPGDSQDIPAGGQYDWQRHSFRFGQNIVLDAFENALVANNRINDKHWLQDMKEDGLPLPQEAIDAGITYTTLEDTEWEVDDFLFPEFLVRIRNIKVDGETVGEEYAPISDTCANGKCGEYEFSYTDHYAINVRGSSSAKLANDSLSENYYLYHENPTYFKRNQIIRDNFVYATMRVKIYASGDGLIIKDNVLKDRPGKIRWVHVTGWKIVSPANTLENRGIDWSGVNVLIEGNDIEVSRHRMLNGTYYSVDGEGILFQECCGGTLVDGITIRDNTVNAYIGIYKQPYLRDVLIEDNVLQSCGPCSTSAFIMVEANTNFGKFPLKDITVRNNATDRNIRVTGDVYVPGEDVGDVYGNFTKNGVIYSPGVDVYDNYEWDGTLPLPGSPTPLDPSKLTEQTPATAIDPEPAVDLALAIHPQDAEIGELITLTATVTNPGDLTTPLEKIRIYNRGMLVAETTSATSVSGVTIRGYDDLYSAVAEQEAVTITWDSGSKTRSFREFTNVLANSLPTPGVDFSTYNAWLDAQGFDSAVRNDPNLSYLDLDADFEDVVGEYVRETDPQVKDYGTMIAASMNEGQASIVIEGSNDLAVVTKLYGSRDLTSWEPLEDLGVSYQIESTGDDDYLLTFDQSEEERLFVEPEHSVRE